MQMTFNTTYNDGTVASTSMRAKRRSMGEVKVVQIWVSFQGVGTFTLTCMVPICTYHLSIDEVMKQLNSMVL